MNAERNKWKLGALARRLIVLPVLVAVVGLAFTAAASAQVAFQATVKGVNNPLGNLGPCVQTIPSTYVTTHVFCGSTSIAGYGPVTWTLNATSVTPVSSACFDYTGITTFQLLSGDGTLVVDESAQACAPGSSGSAPSQDYFRAPLFANASWTVDPATTGPLASTGVFAGVSGAGTDTLQSGGPQLTGTYTGTLVPRAGS
jgi:hypothetical protein